MSTCDYEEAIRAGACTDELRLMELAFEVLVHDGGQGIVAMAGGFV